MLVWFATAAAASSYVPRSITSSRVSSYFGWSGTNIGLIVFLQQPSHSCLTPRRPKA